MILSEMTTMRKLMLLHGIVGGKSVEDFASGNPCVFTTDIAKPLRRLSLSLLPRQSGTGDPSPSNIRPLLPWGEVGTWMGGKNLLDLSSLRGGNFDTPAPTFPTTNIATGDYIPIKGGQTYVWSQSVYTSGSNQGRYIRWYNSEKEQIGAQSIYITSASIIEAPQDAVYARFMWYRASYFNSLNDVIAMNPQIELGTTPTSFVPYTPITPHPVNLTGITPPVYGGTLDIVSGVLTVEWAMVDLGTLSWVYYNQYASFVAPVNGKIPYVDNRYDYGIMSSGFRAVNFWWTNNNKPDKTMSCGAQTNICIKHTGFTNAAEFKAAMSGVQLVYELATPLTYQLTPQQISALVGVNTVWSDADGVEVTYLKKG